MEFTNAVKIFLIITVCSVPVHLQGLPRCPGSEGIATNCAVRPGDAWCHSDWLCGPGRRCCTYGCGQHSCYNVRDVCYLPKDSGRCYAYIPRWYYNFFTRRCERFIYGGCEGNGNNFETYRECVFTCRFGFPYK